MCANEYMYPITWFLDNIASDIITLGIIREIYNLFCLFCNYVCKQSRKCSNVTVEHDCFPIRRLLYPAESWVFISYRSNLNIVFIIFIKKLREIIGSRICYQYGASVQSTHDWLLKQYFNLIIDPTAVVGHCNVFHLLKRKF